MTTRARTTASERALLIAALLFVAWQCMSQAGDERTERRARIEAQP